MKTVKPGIRQKPNGKYLATKSIQGKRYYEEFETLRMAQKWKNEFHPMVRPVVTEVTATPSANLGRNGGDKSILFLEVYERYKNGKLKTLSVNKQYKKELRMNRFFPPLFSVPMCDMAPAVITRLIEDQKLMVTTNHGRCSFNEELKYLASVFNWYKDEVDFTFHNPVMKYHKKIAQIRAIPKKDKIMEPNEVVLFIDTLREPFKTMAICQFSAALRINEVAALNELTVNLDAGEMDISEVFEWHKNIPIHKYTTKTNENIAVKMNDEMIMGLRSLNRIRPRGCIYFFQANGRPLGYNQILDAYNEAFKASGLKYSGTHVLRHTRATLARRKHGLDACQAILRHTTSRMSEHYGKLDVNEKASMVVIEAGEIFRRGRATNATNEREILAK